MALEGLLADRGLGELFQLLASQHKTGLLEVTGLVPGPDLQVSLLSGRVVRLEYSGRPTDVLGQLLVAARVVEPRQLRAALKLQKASPATPLGEVLVAQGALDRETRDHFLRLQIRERLYGLFAASAGRYKFQPRPPNFTKPAFDPVGADTVLMEGIRRAEEWPLIRTRVLNDGAVFRVLRRPEADDDEAAALARALDDAFSEVVDDDEPGVGPNGQKRLSRAERRVLDLVDGKRSVAQVVLETRLGSFETCKALYNLAQAGYLEVARTGRGRAGAGAQGRSGGAVALRVLVNLAVVGGLGLGSWQLWAHRSAVAANAEELGESVGTRLRANRIVAISTALEIHRLTHGVYPDALQTLADLGLVAPFVLEPIDGRPWDYVGVGLDYDLR